MKKIMTSLVLALFATAALAQQKQGSFSFVPRVGVTIANLTDNDLTLERGGTIKSKAKPDLPWAPTPSTSSPTRWRSRRA